MNKTQYKLALVKAGYTQERLAKEMGIAQSTLIRKVKNGGLTVNEANAMIELLKIEKPEEIFFAE